ncbi:hypothetical protein NQ318_015858 [Aromia moschata]|uniref:Uncharacterized protein n=1 Tax=Aromia moschata TaxID=1265417 RepID=A0AAV8YP48_9CUCU|nr:hypothetical protein NQ318_015858 [Aromia moschata]
MLWASLLSTTSSAPSAYIHNTLETLITTIYTHLQHGSDERGQFHPGEALHHTIVPFLCKILHGDVPDQLEGRRDAPEKALELLNTIAMYTTQPVSEAMIMQGFSGAANLRVG